MTEKKHRGVIIGAGLMGASKRQQSHASMYSVHPKYELVGIVDICPIQISKATEDWGVKGSTDLHSLINECSPDIVSICSPDRFHAEQLQILSSYPLKAIIVEKPVVLNMENMQLLSHIHSDLIVAVNYSRRYLPIYHELEKKLSEETIRAISIRYSKGLMHNGSHAIDLIRMLVGEVIDYKVLYSSDDYSKNDPSLTVHLSTQKCSNIILQALNQKDYVYFDVEIYTNLNKYSIHSDHECFSHFSVKDNIGCPPGRRLVLENEKQIDHQKSLFYLYDNLASVLEGKKAYLYNLKNALLTEKIAIEINNNYQYADCIE